jgi:hypothetical protein
MDRLLDSFVHLIFKQVSLFELSFMLLSSQVLLASPLLILLHYNLHFLMGCLWKANHHNGSFPLPIFPKKNKIKKNNYMLITNLQEGK